MDEEKFEKVKFDSIRRHYDTDTRKWFFSIVDAISITTKSTDPRNYWKVLKNRLKKSQNQLVTECNQLKMLANDGKFYLTDVADAHTLLNIVQTVAPNSLPYFEQWMDTLDHKKVPLVKNAISEISTLENEEESYPQEDLMLMIDGYEKDNFLFIHALLAGANIENLFISITCDSVTIKGEREVGKNTKDVEYLDQELAWGKFSRTIPLPKEIEISQTEVTEEHGEIKIKLPLINKNRSRIIKVKSL